MASTQEIVATGRRKTSVARVRMTAGSGKIDINGRSFEEYFPTGPLQNTVLQPLQTVKLANAYDISINATGGGASGQAGAVRGDGFVRLLRQNCLDEMRAGLRQRAPKLPHQALRRPA